jgi:hypothetical protein
VNPVFGHSSHLNLRLTLRRPTLFQPVHRLVKVDHQVEFDRLHDWQSATFALKNAAGVKTLLPINFGKVDAIAHQAASYGNVAEPINGRQLMARSQCDQFTTVRDEYRGR